MSSFSGRAAKAPVQREAKGAAPSSTDVHAAADRGTSGSGGALPHAARIQAAFGSHDVGNVQAYTGGAASEASTAMGAEAYATGDKVAFRGVPSLHTAAHEAAHVIQQRAGVSLSGGVGQVGDSYERHADAVADAVVQGKSAEGLLGRHASGGASGVQMRNPPGASARPAPGATPGTTPTAALPPVPQFTLQFTPPMARRFGVPIGGRVTVPASRLTLGGRLTLPVVGGTPAPGHSEGEGHGPEVELEAEGAPDGSTGVQLVLRQPLGAGISLVGRAGAEGLRPSESPTPEGGPAPAASVGAEARRGPVTVGVAGGAEVEDGHVAPTVSASAEAHLGPVLLRAGLTVVIPPGEEHPVVQGTVGATVTF